MGNLPTCASELFLFAIFEGGKCAALCSSPLNLSSRLSAKWQSENYSLCLRIRAQNRKPTKTERQTERNLERGVTSKWARDCQFPERQGARKRERCGINFPPESCLGVSHVRCVNEVYVVYRLDLSMSGPRISTSVRKTIAHFLAHSWCTPQRDVSA